MTARDKPALDAASVSDVAESVDCDCALSAATCENIAYSKLCSRRLAAATLHALSAEVAALRERAEVAEVVQRTMSVVSNRLLDAERAARQRAEAERDAARAAALEEAATLADAWAKMDADIGAMKAAVSRLLGPDWPDEGAPVATVRELAATRQYTATGLAHAIRALKEPQR